MSLKNWLLNVLVFGFSFSCSKNPNPPYPSDSGLSHTIFFFLFQNKEVYHAQVGDVVPIYYSINSCCFNCAPNKDELRNLKFLGEKLIIGSPRECTGCDVMIGMFFRAESVGVDTILRMHTAPYAECNKELKGFDKFIVNIH